MREEVGRAGEVAVVAHRIMGVLCGSGAADRSKRSAQVTASDLLEHRLSPLQLGLSTLEIRLARVQLGLESLEALLLLLVVLLELDSSLPLRINDMLLLLSLLELPLVLLGRVVSLLLSSIGGTFSDDQRVRLGAETVFLPGQLGELVLEATEDALARRRCRSSSALGGRRQVIVAFENDALVDRAYWTRDATARRARRSVGRGDIGS